MSSTAYTEIRKVKRFKQKLFVITALILVAHLGAFIVGRIPVSAEDNAPQYEIRNTKHDVGVARNTEYYVLVDEVDLSNDNFKQEVKAIFTDLAKKEQSPDFGATIFSDSGVLAYYEGGLDYFNDLNETGLISGDGSVIPPQNVQAAFQDWSKEMAVKSETALLASYTGGFNLETGEVSQDDEAYSILWFGSTNSQHPTVGKYAGDEQWKPTVEQSDENKDSDCFIATAAYGTHLTHDLDVLRNFRDNSMRTSTVGSTFVDAYYHTGPVAARFIEDKPLLRGYVRDFYIKPMVTLVELFEN